MGSDFRDFLAEEGILPEVEVLALKRAVYHVMAREDGGKAVFEDDKDRCGRTTSRKRIASPRCLWVYWAFLTRRNNSRVAASGCRKRR